MMTNWLWLISFLTLLRVTSLCIDAKPPDEVLTSFVTQNNLTDINVAVFAPRNQTFAYSIRQLVPYLKKSLQEIENLQLLPTCNVSLYLFDSTPRDPSMTEIQAIALALKPNYYAFVGPVHDESLRHVARIMRHLNYPVLSVGGLDLDFGVNKTNVKKYSTLVQVNPTVNSIGNMVFYLLSFRFMYKKVTILTEKHSYMNFCESLAVTFDYIMNSYKSKHDKYFTFQMFALPKQYDEEEVLIREVGLSYAVVVLCASADSVRNIMIKAHELNFDNGEYVFFNIDLFSSKNESAKPWYNATDTPERNEKARKAYEALMTVTLRKPVSREYKNFSQEVKRRAKLNNENFTYGEEEVNSFVGAFHDAVLLYAIALNETLEAKGNITNGTEITRRMWNRTFTGITGNVSIDANGDRNADYSLLDMDPETGEFQVVANYFGNTKQYEPVPGRSIRWAGGYEKAPPDTPKCGFDGSKCPPEEPFSVLIIVSIVVPVVLVLGFLIVFIIVYRRMKFQAELDQMNWRVRWEDINLGTSEGDRKEKRRARAASNMSLARRYSVASSCSRDTIAVHLSDVGQRQQFNKTVLYKQGTIVAVKKIYRPSVTITRKLLLEIKRVKDLGNEHVARFIGACIDYPDMWILTEYCQKGSLQDLLENDQMKLDWMFKYSLMQDIVRGMVYICGSDIKSHGALKSTNCLVDSRFVVKLTDFGLYELRGTNEDVEEGSYLHYRSLQWTAPELLRMQHRPPCGTMKGDVYSFGIICQEIVYRKGVFYINGEDHSTEVIVQKVKTGLRPPFRPMLDPMDCPCDELAEVIRKCWAEDPMERPDFETLKSRIRKLNKDGDKGNLLDNLLFRMGQYANNLESLVEERTADYLEQKKRAEDLLYAMLPRTVAEHLVCGETVLPEAFDAVTIYFSDICGFTQMSAESTPMQVVDLLNDLYTAFDSIIEIFDVYKVETIGDAYVVVSGLPQRNGNLHVREIARMSIALLNCVMSFKIRHRPNEQLKIRIGIHTGPVVAGVVGLKMPRYCLFGDTVNTCSRMESNGLPLRIHVSPYTHEVLQVFGTFDMESRGPVEMKGKGVVNTYWLLGERSGSSIGDQQILRRET